MLKNPCQEGPPGPPGLPWGGAGRKKKLKSPEL